MRQSAPNFPIDISEISLVGYYGIALIVTTIGVTVVLILNLFTPLEFIREEILGGIIGADLNPWEWFVRILVPRMLMLLTVSYGLAILSMYIMLRPIAVYLARERSGRFPMADLGSKARRRLVNLPLIFIPVNVGMWILIPVMVALLTYLAGHVEFRTAIILAARAAMVGLIASAVASHRIESFSRRKLIPFFFSEGRLTDLKGAKRISISKRIRFFSRLGAIVPLTILLVTLLTLQWEVDSSVVTAEDYGRGILVFTGILFIYAFVATGTLNRVVNRSIARPIKEMVRVLNRVRGGDFDAKVRVVSNDEIGHIGDVINEMTDGLKEREYVRQSLELAREVQQNLLPKDNPVIEGLDIAGMSIYCDETGGDYYDFIMPDTDSQGNIRIVLGDVSGHGVSSALLMATARAMLRQRSLMPGSIGEIVSDVNRLLCQDVLESGSFMTLFYLAVDPKNKGLTWVRAGHDPALFYAPQSDTFKTLKGPGLALGLDENWVYSEEELNGICAGQIIVLYTDGVWESHNLNGKMFGKKALRTLIRNNQALSARQIAAAVIDELKAFQTGVDPEDDVTLIVVKIDA